MEIIGVRALRHNLAEYLEHVEQGEEYIIVQRSKPVARLMPYREDTVSQEPTPKTYADIDEDRRAAFVQDTLDRLRQLVGNDRLEALRVLNEMEAALLTNGGQP